MKENKVKKEEKPTRNNYPWTEEEIEDLYWYWGMYSIPTIAKRLNRSACAIRKKATALGLGKSIYNSDLIPLAVLLREFSINYRIPFSLMKTVKTAGLKIHTLRVDKRSYQMVDIKEFWEFAEKNAHLFDFSRLKDGALGAEPEWVKTVRAENFKRKLVLRNDKKVWTKQEENELIRLIKTKEYSLLEISKRTGRSEAAIRKRLLLLKVDERAVLVSNSPKWSQEELLLLQKMIKEEKSYETMSQSINRSASAIRSKVKNLYGLESLPKVREKLRSI